jgi:hypothetical protein
MLAGRLKMGDASNANSRLCRDARGRHERVCKELVAG